MMKYGRDDYITSLECSEHRDIIINIMLIYFTSEYRRRNEFVTCAYDIVTSSSSPYLQCSKYDVMNAIDQNKDFFENISWRLRGSNCSLPGM